MIGPTLVVSPQAATQPNTTEAKFRTPSGRTALRWLRNRSLGFSKILIEPGIWDEDFASLILEARKFRPITPIWILGHEDGLSELELARLGVTGRVPRTLQINDADKQSQPLSQSVSLLDDGEYLGIPLADFLDLDQVQFDIYLKTPQGKWACIALAGETGLGSRIQTYWSRGLGYLYIQKAAFQRQLDAIHMFGSLLPTSANGSGILRTARAISDSTKVLQSLKSMEQIAQETWDSVSESILLINRSWNEGPWNDPRTALRNAALLDHSVSVLVIALILGREMGFTSPESSLKLGLAAAFHDIGLLGHEGNLPPNEQKDAAEQLSARQKEFFLSHPARGAEWINQNFRNESLVAQAVALHHWRRDGSGFYERGSQPVIDAPRIAEIVGISEELSYQFLKFPFGIHGARLEGVIQSVSDRFSTAVMAGTRDALMPAIRIRPA